MKVNLSKLLVSTVVTVLISSIGACAAFANVTWDPNKKTSNVVLSDGDLTAQITSRPSAVLSTEAKTTGKWYWEIEVQTAQSPMIGIAYSSYNMSSLYIGSTKDSYGYWIGGTKYPGLYGTSDPYASSYRSSDVIGVALDLDNKTLAFYKNGVSQGIAYSNLPDGSVYAAVSQADSGGVSTFHASFSANQLKYPIPQGFAAFDGSMVASGESITIESPVDEVKVGQTFTTDVVLHNATNICAEDVAINYNSELFEYLGSEEVAGFKNYKEVADPTTGSVRFIVASRGKDFAITGDKTFIKLKFRAKKQGVGVVDSATARIADNGTIEKDIPVEFCGEKTITVKGIQDVNRSGSFTLLDLGIDAWYFGSSADATDTTKYDADVVIDNKIDDLDLSAIVEAMLENTEYRPHN